MDSFLREIFEGELFVLEKKAVIFSGGTRKELVWKGWGKGSGEGGFPSSLSLTQREEERVCTFRALSAGFRRPREIGKKERRRRRKGSALSFLPEEGEEGKVLAPRLLSISTKREKEKKEIYSPSWVRKEEKKFPSPLPSEKKKGRWPSESAAKRKEKRGRKVRSPASSRGKEGRTKKV